MKKTEIDKLLEIASRKRGRKLKYQDDVLAFIYAYGLERGRVPVKASVLKKLYKNWSDEPVTPYVLGCRLLELFMEKNGFYLVNKTALKLSEPLYEKLAAEKTKLKVVKQLRVHQFIRDNELKSGRFWYRTDVLFKVFKKWSETIYKRKSLIPLTKFIRTFKLIGFSYKITGEAGKTYIGINKRLETSRRSASALKRWSKVEEKKEETISKK
jgi:hypothetical protein